MLATKAVTPLCMTGSKQRKHEQVVNLVPVSCELMQQCSRHISSQHTTVYSEKASCVLSYNVAEFALITLYTAFPSTSGSSGGAGSSDQHQLRHKARDGAGLGVTSNATGSRVGRAKGSTNSSALGSTGVLQLRHTRSPSVQDYTAHLTCHTAAGCKD